MKRLVAAFLSVLIIYAMYLDITKGTLPKEEKRMDNPATPSSTNTTNIPYFEKQIKPGDTVLSIVEQNLENPLPVSISQVIEDFEELNGGEKPEKIVIGKSYRFPDYQKFE